MMFTKKYQTIIPTIFSYIKHSDQLLWNYGTYTDCNYLIHHDD